MSINLKKLREALEACRNSNDSDTTTARRFPTAQRLVDSNIAPDLETAEVARLLWRQVWAFPEKQRLKYGLSTPVLDELPQTRAWLRSSYNGHTPISIRREALNELLGFHGVEPLYKTRRERINGAWETVNTDEVFARYLNAGDPYVATLIFRVNATGPTIGCWGDLPEVNK